MILSDKVKNSLSRIIEDPECVEKEDVIEALASMLIQMNESGYTSSDLKEIVRKCILFLEG